MSDTDTFNIKDHEGNVLTTEDNIFYYLKYIANNEVSRKLKKQYSGESFELFENDLDSTLDTLI